MYQIYVVVQSGLCMWWVWFVEHEYGAGVWLACAQVNISVVNDAVLLVGEAELAISLLYLAIHSTIVQCRVAPLGTGTGSNGGSALISVVPLLPRSLHS